MSTRLNIIILVFFTVVSLGYGDDGQTIADQRTFTPFTGIGENALSSISGNNSLLHLGACVSTLLLINTDIDYRIQKHFSENQQLNPVTVPSVWMGYTLPLVLGGGLYFYGKANSKSELTASGCAVLQASLLAVMYSSFLKAVTGRPQPDPASYADMREASRTFRFGFVRGGIHYGWPSGHLAVNTAAVSSLLWFYPDNIPLKIAGGMYIAYLIFGVTAHEGSTMHWFSDVVAGTLIGGAIGSTVGRNFRQLYTQSTAAENSFELTPLLSFDRVGLTFSVKL